MQFNIRDAAFFQKFLISAFGFECKSGLMKSAIEVSSWVFIYIIK